MARPIESWKKQEYLMAIGLAIGEHAVDGEGPLEAGAYSAAYTDNNNNKEIVRSNSYVMSFADNPLFTGIYWVSASVWLEGFGTNAHSGSFQGGVWDYKEIKLSLTLVLFSVCLILLLFLDEDGLPDSYHHNHQQ